MTGIGSYRLIGISVWVVLFLSMPGCSSGDRPPLGLVSGSVTIDGKPLVGAIITFQPTKGRAAEALTDSQGKYDLTYSYNVKGAKVGPNKIAFSWPIGVTGTHVIPECYAGRTELECEVKSGRNTFNFVLESEPSAKSGSTPPDS